MRKFLKLDKLAKSEAGVAAIEFAILLPLLMIVLFGVYQITTFITAVRKIDNVTNDIGYILSREGQIATKNPLTGVYSGGETTLTSVFDNAIPFLIYPYGYNSTDGSSQVKVKLVGLPIFTGCGNADSINRDTVRVMWEERHPANSGAAAVTPDNDQATVCSGIIGANCPDACDIPANGKYKSFYSDKLSNGTIVSRANIIYPGQSFVIVNFAFNFHALLGSNIIGLALPQNVEKLSSYAARSRMQDINGNGKIDPNEVLNNMQFCTDCNTLSSSYTGPHPMIAGGSAFRQPCDTAANINASPQAQSASGCSFY